MCWTKFSCLLLVDAQKSSRTIVVDSRFTSPSSVTNVTLDSLPKGGLVRMMSNRFQEEKVGELLDVIPIRDSVVSQDVAVIPDTLNDCG
jgi:hypothetical protein